MAGNKEGNNNASKQLWGAQKFRVTGRIQALEQPSIEASHCMRVTSESAVLEGEGMLSI